MHARSCVVVVAAALVRCGSEPSNSSAAPAPPATAAPTSRTTATAPDTVAAPPTSPTTAPSSAPAPTPTPSSTAPSSATHHPRARRLSAADRARVEEALRDGRRLTRGGQHAEALARFEAALALDRSAWRVQCEAGFVAWRAENFEAADRLVRAAMNGMPPGFVPEAERVPTAMCLFNAGLVAEARARPDDARELWEASLRLRDNATVRTRLGALPPAPDPRRPWQLLPETASIEDVVAAMRADFAATGLAGFDAGAMSEDEILLEISPVEGESVALAAHRVHASFEVGEGGRQLLEAIVVRAAGVRHVALLAQSYDAGVSESSTTLDVEARREDVLPGGASELIVEVRAWGGSSGYTEMWGETRRAIVCSVDTGTLACIALPLAELSGEAGGERIDDEPSVEIEGSCRTLAFEAGQVRFERCAGDAAEVREPAFIDGTHELRVLLAREDLAWPVTWTTIEPLGS